MCFMLDLFYYNIAYIKYICKLEHTLTLCGTNIIVFVPVFQTVISLFAPYVFHVGFIII